MITIPLTPPGRTDFSGWDRKVLERFAREAADENKQLREDLRLAIDAYRRAMQEVALCAG